MPEVLPALVAAASSVAVALISAGIVGRRKKQRATESEPDPFLMEMFHRWEKCEKRLTAIIRQEKETGRETGRIPPSS